MDEMVVEITGLSEAEAVAAARREVEADGFETLRVRTEDLTADPWQEPRRYRVHLFGDKK